MTFINKFKYIGENPVIFQEYSLYLNEVRKNLAASANCSCVALPSGRRIATIPVGDLDRSPLIREPLNKSYGVSASPEACRCKAQREGNGLSPWRGLQRGRCMLQDSPFGVSSAIQTRRCNFLPCHSMPAKSRLDSGLRWKPVIP